MPPRGRPRSGTSRMDAAIHAMKQFGFDDKVITANMRELLKVPGELLDHLTCWDALRSSLPAGPVTGVPKVKAMELIDKLEVTRRGPYSGGFGWISFTGEMGIALCLRTMVFPTDRYDAMYLYKNDDARKEWIAHIQMGAEIVADSVPEDEQHECENKAAGLARDINLAEPTFVGK